VTLDEPGEFGADVIGGEFEEAAVVEGALGHGAGAAGDVGVEGAVDTAEGAADVGVAGAEEDGGGEAEVGGEVGEEAVVGEEGGAAGEGVEEGGEIGGVVEKRGLFAEAGGEFGCFGGAVAEDEDLEFCIEDELGDLLEAIEGPAVGGAELGAGGDGDAGDDGAGREGRGAEVGGDHGHEVEFLEEGHVVADAVLGRAEWWGGVEGFVEVRGKFVEAVAEALLDAEFGEGLGGGGGLPGDGGFEADAGVFERTDKVFDRGAFVVGNDVIVAAFAFPEWSEGGGGGDGDGGVRPGIAQAAEGGCGEAGFHGILRRGDDQVAATQMEWWLVGNRDGLGHVRHEEEMLGWGRWGRNAGVRGGRW